MVKHYIFRFLKYGPVTQNDPTVSQMGVSIRLFETLQWQDNPFAAAAAEFSSF